MAPTELEVDELCYQFIDFTGLARTDRPRALAFLQGESYDLQRAVAQFYDHDGSVEAYTRLRTPAWDESAFAGDRDGGHLNERAMIPYNENIIGPQAAPSRPPSRNQNNAQHLGDSSGWGNTSISWGSARYEGENEAIERSLRDQGQETGITSSWGGQGHSSCEVVPDVEPSQRRRQSGQPAFLRPLANRDFFPAILAILSQIPACRKALMFEDAVYTSPSYNENWWRGESIAHSSVKYSGPDEPPDSPTEEKALEIAHECQRVMAFLLATKRSYGSCYQLADLLDIQPDYPPTWYDSAPFGRGLEHLDVLLSMINDPIQLFRSDIQDRGDQSLKRSAFIDAVIEKDGMSLYDALDNALWGSIGDAGHSGWTSTNFLLKIAPTAVIRLRTRDAVGPMQTIKIPEIFFADRYLASNAARIDEARDMIAQTERKKTACRDKLTTLATHYVNPPLVEVDAMKMMAKTLEYTKQSGEVQMKDGTMELEDSPRRIQFEPELITQLETLVKRVEQRAADLQREQENLAEQLSAHASVLTPQAQEESAKPEVAYRLRGAACADHRRPFIVYVAVEPEGPTADRNETTQNWWRMSYDVAGARPEVTVEAATAEDVLAFASVCNPEVLLVYASEESLRDTGMPDLPPALQEFVARDNVQFESELRDAESEAAGASTSQMEAMPPGHVNETYGYSAATGGRRLSNDSTTVQGGGSRRSSFDADREMMMSAEAEMHAFSSHKMVEEEQLLGQEMQEVKRSAGGPEDISMADRDRGSRDESGPGAERDVEGDVRMQRR